MDSDMQATDAGTIELGHRLEAYARARLSPDPRSTARARARVMREARLSFEAARIAVHVIPAMAASRRSMRRRMLMPFLAAAMWLALAVGTMAASQAGGPLYPSRMWIENAMLPSGANARTVADLNRLDARLAEALSGAATGNRDAVVAALDAYYLIADEAIAESASDSALQAMVAEALDQHRAVLTAIAARLADKGNVNASEAIERNIQRAIDHNAAVVRGIGSRGNPQGGAGGGAAGGSGTGGAGTGVGAGAGGGDGGAGSSPAGGGGSPARTPAPSPSPRPVTATEKPAHTPKPVPVGQPDHTPRAPGN
jgi:uncharacterized membrane protein YgcG